MPTIEGENIPDEVSKAFNETALDLIQRGFKNFGAFGIINKIRWEMALAYGDRKFKCSNNWAPLLSREFARLCPEHKDFFRFKRRKNEAVAA